MPIPTPSPLLPLPPSTPNGAPSISPPYNGPCETTGPSGPNATPNPRPEAAPDHIDPPGGKSCATDVRKALWDNFAGDDIGALRDPKAAWWQKGLAGADLASNLGGPLKDGFEIGGKMIVKSLAKDATTALTHDAANTALHATARSGSDAAGHIISGTGTAASHGATNLLRHETLPSIEAARNLKNPKPDTVYTIPETAGPAGNPARTFRTDSLGRPVESTGVLGRSLHGLRNPSVDAKIGKSVQGSDKKLIGFHLGADRFGFPGGRLNVTPGLESLNKSSGEWGKLETQLAALQKNHTVDAKFEAIYNKGNLSTKPDKFMVTYTVDGKNPPTRAIFPNE